MEITLIWGQLVEKASTQCLESNTVSNLQKWLTLTVINEFHHASQHLDAISDSAFSRQRILVGTATTLLTTWGMTILVMCEFYGKEASDVHQSVRVNKHLCWRQQHIPVLQLRSGQ
ncbi:hypothetical protein Bca52824_083491 [Brassica carinata]|uniref:Uncharacterized protein n=2 Tax=Brassica TaxID=3705 RepID=A0A8X7PKW1_BRACI|nr:hypothetical protein Bca52824_083491 [Brassica carinata]